MNKKVKILLAVVIGLLFSLSFLFFYRNYYNTKPKASTDNTWNFTFDGQDGVGSDKYLLNVMVKPPVNAQPGANKIRSLKLIFKYPNSLFNDISSSDIVLQSPFVQSKTQASGVVPGTNEIELALESGLDEKGNLLPQSPLVATINFTKKLTLTNDIKGRFEFKSFKLIDGLGVEVASEATKVDLPIVAGPDGKIRANLPRGIGSGATIMGFKPEGDGDDLRLYSDCDPKNNNCGSGFKCLQYNSSSIGMLIACMPLDGYYGSFCETKGNCIKGLDCINRECKVPPSISCQDCPVGFNCYNNHCDLPFDPKYCAYNGYNCEFYPGTVCANIGDRLYKECSSIKPKTCWVEKPLPRGDNEFHIIWSGTANRSTPKTVRAYISRIEDNTLIDPLPSGFDTTPINKAKGFYYAFSNSCSSSTEMCYAGQTIKDLPAGKYYIMCEISGSEDPEDRPCTGNPRCGVNFGTEDCPGYNSCLDMRTGGVWETLTVVQTSPTPTPPSFPEPTSTPVSFPHSTPTPTTKPKACFVYQPTINGNRVDFSWLGISNRSTPEPLGSFISRADRTQISPIPVGLGTEIPRFDSYFYKLNNTCNTGMQDCRGSQSIENLPPGEYYFMCHLETPPDRCTGNYRCSINKGDYNCEDWLSCSDQDYIKFTVPSNSSVTNTPTPTPTKTPTNTPTKTPTITPTITTSPSCQCTNNKCTDSCKDASGGKLINFACSTIVNCSTDRNRTKGDSIGTTMTCLDDYVELMNAIHGKYNGKDEQNKVRRLRSDFNGDDEVGNKDLEIFKANYKPEDCMVGIPPIPPP